jgi:hypothetical protein
MPRLLDMPSIGAGRPLASSAKQSVTTAREGVALSDASPSAIDWLYNGAISIPHE